MHSAYYYNLRESLTAILKKYKKAANFIQIMSEFIEQILKSAGRLDYLSSFKGKNWIHKNIRELKIINIF